MPQQAKQIISLNVYINIIHVQFRITYTYAYMWLYIIRALHVNITHIAYTSCFVLLDHVGSKKCVQCFHQTAQRFLFELPSCHNAIIKLVKCTKLTFIPWDLTPTPIPLCELVWLYDYEWFCDSESRLKILKVQTKNGELQIFYLWRKDAQSISENRQFRPSLADVIWELRSCRWIFSGPCQSCANGTPLRPFFQLVGKGIMAKSVDDVHLCTWRNLLGLNLQ